MRSPGQFGGDAATIGVFLLAIVYAAIGCGGGIGDDGAYDYVPSEEYSAEACHDVCDALGRCDPSITHEACEMQCMKSPQAEAMNECFHENVEVTDTGEVIGCEEYFACMDDAG
jgi:hypothetical protein